MCRPSPNRYLPADKMASFGGGRRAQLPSLRALGYRGAARPRRQAVVARHGSGPAAPVADDKTKSRPKTGGKMRPDEEKG
jgi:hypothetical protein